MTPAATSGKTWSDHDVAEKMSTVLKIWRVDLEGLYGMLYLTVKG